MKRIRLRNFFSRRREDDVRMATRQYADILIGSLMCTDVSPVPPNFGAQSEKDFKNLNEKSSFVQLQASLQWRYMLQ